MADHRHESSAACPLPDGSLCGTCPDCQADAINDAQWPDGGIAVVIPEQPAASTVARIREIVSEAKPGLRGRPRDCTEHCSDGECNCSGVWPVLAWDIDVPALWEVLNASE